MDKVDIPYFEETFKIRHYDVDTNGFMRAYAIFRILQETAGEHHTFVNDNLLKLYNSCQGWFLLQAVMEFERLPRYGDVITVRTWLSEIGNIKAQREYLLLDQLGNVIGKAEKFWAFFDIKRRRPIQIPDEIRLKWPMYEQKVFDNPVIKNTPVEEPDYSALLTVRKTDLDLNGHVNNLRYIEWLWEALPADIDNYRLKFLNAKFLNETKYKEQLSINTKVTKQTPPAFIHAVKNADTGKTAFIAETQFVNI